MPHKANEECFSNGIRIYTDGSGYNGTIGAAAILFSEGEKQAKLCYQLGPNTQHMVFKGELVAIILGMHLAHNIVETCPKITFNIDNQVMIKTLLNNHLQPAQYLINKIKHNIATLHHNEITRQQAYNINNYPKMEITFVWVTGHQGSKGNEAVDKLVKEAAKFSSSDKNLLPAFLQCKLPISLSAIKQQITTNTKLNMKEWWKCSQQYKQMKNVDPTMPSEKYIKATNGLTCCQTSVLTQFCTGHILLNKHLHCINRSESPDCPHCPNIMEDATHLLFYCNRYAFQ
jgi:ribonuclease HI